MTSSHFENSLTILRRHTAAVIFLWSVIVGVSVPITHYFEMEKKASAIMYLSHGIFWLLGLAGIAFVFTRSKQQIVERAVTDDELRKKSLELEQLNLYLENRVADEVEKNRRKDLLMFEQSRQIAMGELLINIAHQWRQPLNAIGILIQDVRDAYKYKELTAESLDSSTNTIMAELLGLSGTIKTFTDIYTQDENKKEFNILQTVQRCLAFLADQIILNNVKVETGIGEDISVHGYPNIIFQAVTHIILNSLDAFKEKKIKDGHIIINAVDDMENHKIIISISDNGGGIDKEIIDKVFDPYFTTKFKTREKGLGLYLLKTMTEKKMEGAMSFKNTQDGAEFIIEVYYGK
jgi:signal transduction histidine kinase